MQLDAMFLQLGIAGAMLLVMYRIAMRWMTNERERQQASAKAEADRTTASIVAESERTKAIHDGFRADIEAHKAITDTMQRLGNQFARIEGKLDTIFDLTTVREQVAYKHTINGPKVIVERDIERDDDSTPVDRPFVSRQTPSHGVPRQTPPLGVPAMGGGGEYSRVKPKK